MARSLQHHGNCDPWLLGRCEPNEPAVCSTSPRVLGASSLACDGDPGYLSCLRRSALYDCDKRTKEPIPPLIRHLKPLDDLRRDELWLRAARSNDRFDQLWPVTIASRRDRRDVIRHL